MKTFWRRGEPLVWLSGSTLTIILLITAVLLTVVIINGMGVFWPHRIAQATLNDGTRLLGEIVGEEQLPNSEARRLQFKIGNRDLYGLDFRWVDRSAIASLDHAAETVVLERMEYGNFYGTIQHVNAPDTTLPQVPWDALQAGLVAIEPSVKEAEALGHQIQEINEQMERVRLKQQKLTYHGKDQPAVMEPLKATYENLNKRFEQLVEQRQEFVQRLHGYTVTMADANGRTRDVALNEIVRAYRPNQMTRREKIRFYAAKLGELLVAQPRESNTEGGLFPAIFGTVLMVLLMSVLSFPFGVMAGIYLREYAKDGWMVRAVRIAVNNLAGIPSIVYGVFGLGFFVYGVGGSLDQLFFPERLPTPTFGTGGILWASLTLGLLTIPVVIVSTEEAFGAIPRGVREASLALGSTKLQTLTRVLFPMASPGILTGFILAMERAAGEVAPLMITGVVKLAPALPLDGQYPYVHFNRKFMHLGFHIYDIGFQSPNVEAAKPMVFVTTLLLVLIVLLLTSTAIGLRNRMRRKFAMGTF